MIKNKYNMINKIYIYIVSVFIVSACAIENDIPYPIVDGAIESMVLEGQTASEGTSDANAVIDKTNRTVDIVVNDAVNISKLSITKLTVSNDATLLPDESKCNNYSKFPQTGFEDLSELPVSTDTRMDFTKPVKIVLRTYQDYEWTINVTQLIEREINVESQVKSVIDPINRNVVIYVDPSQSLDRIKVYSFDIAGKSGSVFPDPTESEYVDFSKPVKFMVSYGWEETSQPWYVYVYHASEDDMNSSMEVFARTVSADIKGSVQSGKEPLVEYKKETDNAWIVQKQSDVTVSGTSFSTTLKSLEPDKNYVCKVSVDGVEKSNISFTTYPKTTLENGSFDEWHQVNNKLWNPWSEGSSSFWDTGNKGSTTIGTTNVSMPSDDTSNGSGKAAQLKSTQILGFFAAGSIFTGSYVNTVGSNGVLSFGRSFSSFPTKLKFSYKYTPQTINKTKGEFSYLAGRPDSCFIYVALTDWNEPREIRTDPNNRQLFDKNDTKVIAYGEFIQGSSTTEYQEKEINLLYKYTNRVPKYLLIVATSSKYGDYFTGGVGSELFIDNMELVYE